MLEMKMEMKRLADLSKELGPEYTVIGLNGR